MGRLLKKKPASKRKKKSKDGDDLTSDQSQNGASEKKTLPFANFAMNTLKESLFRKKESAVVKPPKENQGNNYLQQGLQFLREVRVELKKVTWPPRSQAMGSTVVVIVLVMIISLFLGMVDIGLSNIVRWVLH